MKRMACNNYRWKAANQSKEEEEEEEEKKKMMADISPDGIMCMSTCGLQIGHLTLRGLVTDNTV
jgi:hypothetical protein